MAKLPYTKNEQELLDKFEDIKKRADVREYMRLKKSTDVETYHRYANKVALMEAAHKTKEIGQSVHAGIKRLFNKRG